MPGAGFGVFWAARGNVSHGERAEAHRRYGWRHVDVFTVVATSGQACRLEFAVANAAVNGGHAAAEMGRELPQDIAMLDVSAVDPGPVDTARDEALQQRTPRTH